MSNGDVIRRRVRRVVSEAEFVNTINVRDRVTIDFVWFPGAPIPAQSYIAPAVPNHPATGQAREITYTWTREGQAPLTRPMTSGRLTVSLPPGAKGTLQVFGTTWEITRVAAGTAMTPVDQLRGVQERLNRLGYHLRAAGYNHSGIDGRAGARTEHAILQFQNDYSPPVGAPPAAANMLHVRGEWTENTDASYVANIRAYHCNTCANPSMDDGIAFRAAVRATVGA